MDFLPFPKISSASSPSSADSSKFIAQEKLHGAQLVVGINTKEIRFGKRKQWLELNDLFFGWKLIQTQVRSIAQRLFLEFDLPQGSTLYIYGELIGGLYPHPKLELIKGYTAVQTGVWYAPDLHWAPFDAVVKSEVDSENLKFVDPLKLSETVVKCGGLSPALLGQGNRSELTRLSNRFLTKVPTQLGLPEIDSNWAEGFVIKPLGELAPKHRFVSKHKIEEFDEKKFDESQAWSNDQILSFSELSKLVVRMINGSRIDSARSKVGGDSRAAVLAEAALDIRLDLEEVFPTAMSALTMADEIELDKFILDQLSAFLSLRI